MSIRRLVHAIKHDFKTGYYQEGDVICFDLVIMYDKSGLRRYIVENKYKLSKPIIDLDYGKEAVIIPLDIKPLVLRTQNSSKDIYIRLNGIRRQSGYLCYKNLTLIKKLVSVVNMRYGNEEKNCTVMRGIIK